MAQAEPPFYNLDLPVGEGAGANREQTGVMDAIRTIEAGIASGRREMLLAMATGTGKTKTCIALIYRMRMAIPSTTLTRPGGRACWGGYCGTRQQ